MKSRKTHDVYQHHVGKIIRDWILLPRKISVTEAALQLNVSRPTLSNLLNGNSELSPSMASKIEATFNCPGIMLLSFQSIQKYIVFTKKHNVWPQNNKNAR
jgi:addiction module HigA family antidote